MLTWTSNEEGEKGQEGWTKMTCGRKKTKEQKKRKEKRRLCFSVRLFTPHVL
jgi:hypothetical protein